MADFSAPVEEMRFYLAEVADLPGVARLPGCEEATPDLAEAVLIEAGKLASGLIAPLNAVGDREGCVLENGVVRTPEGTKEAYRAFVEGGWNALPFDAEQGGQGLPWTLALSVQELWQGANLAFGLCPLLTQGAVELLQAHGNAEQKARYLPKLVSGEWTGTMNITEPQAGSDVGALRTRAVKAGDNGSGRYRITGQKIYITYGEHDLAENIVHMVLARTPDAPPGSKGVSLFLVPKYPVREDGSLGPRNDLRCASLEHKLGIHASPTAVMAYGDDGGADGWIIGEEGQGMACMFTMMNNARLSVGVQGLGVAERAYQQALAYARERVQGRVLDRPEGTPIVGHPDVKRMLLAMKAQIAAMRALAYTAAAALDHARHSPDETARAEAQGRVDLLTPVVKAWSTDVGCEIASLGVQVHGGMGYIEETGAAQHYRDARITPIYEGTNGIQALDLVARKLGRDGGAAAARFFETLRADLAALPAPLDSEMGPRLAAALAILEETTASLAKAAAREPRRAAAGASPYLRLFGTVSGGVLLGRAAGAARRRQAGQPEGGEGLVAPFAPDFLEGQIAIARFYLDNILPQAQPLSEAALGGAESTLAFDEAWL